MRNPPGELRNRNKNWRKVESSEKFSIKRKRQKRSSKRKKIERRRKLMKKREE